jgi:DNA repair protein RecO (recombination protein O)
MLHKTRGVVFRFTRYGETSIIVNVFTEHFGLQSYIVNGVRSKTGKGKIALYQPLTLLDLVVYHKENASILRLKEVKCLYPYRTLSTDVYKSSIALFINEVVNKAIKEESHAADLCQFLMESLMELDAMTSGAENFHLIFMLQLSRHLGFGPQRTSEILGVWMMEEEDEKMLTRLIDAGYQTPLKMTNAQRRSILDALIRFYNLHIETFGEVKSVEVLREVLG